MLCLHTSVRAQMREFQIICRKHANTELHAQTNALCKHTLCCSRKIAPLCTGCPTEVLPWPFKPLASKLHAHKHAHTRTHPHPHPDPHTHTHSVHPCQHPHPDLALDVMLLQAFHLLAHFNDLHGAHAPRVCAAWYGSHTSVSGDGAPESQHMHCNSHYILGGWLAGIPHEGTRIAGRSGAALVRNVRTRASEHIDPTCCNSDLRCGNSAPHTPSLQGWSCLPRGVPGSAWDQLACAWQQLLCGAPKQLQQGGVCVQGSRIAHQGGNWPYGLAHSCHETSPPLAPGRWARSCHTPPSCSWPSCWQSHPGPGPPGCSSQAWKSSAHTHTLITLKTGSAHTWP